MKLKSVHIALIIMVVILGGVGISVKLGLWHTTNNKVPAVYSSGTEAGEYNPADIKGSYTLNDIQKAFGVPVVDLAKAFGIKLSENTGDFQVKELETIYADLAAQGKEIGAGSVRYFVALYKNLPYEIESGTYFPVSAVEILNEKAKLTELQLEALKKITVKSQTVAQTSEPEKTVIAGTIKSSTTFNELLSWGLDADQIEKVIGCPLPDHEKTIKDFAVEKGVEFRTWKDALQTAVINITK